MKLAVIIVNYNVEYFLEQCLYSVEKAIKGIEAEVFVVDNVSVDGSCDMVKRKFPWVTLIENSENVGFSKANNQAMRISDAEYHHANCAQNVSNASSNNMEHNSAHSIQ